MPRRGRAVAAALAAALVAGLGATTPASVSASLPERASAPQPPALEVREVVTGLTTPWDIKPIGTDDWLITERDTKRLLRWHDGTLTGVAFPAATVWTQRVAGLLGLAIDPDFATNRRFYTCQGGYTDAREGRDAGHEMQVRAWRLSEDGDRAQRRGILLRGIPVGDGTRVGLHVGCRVLPVAGSRMMYVGTGDSGAQTPQDLRSLAGKTLRLDRMSGAPWPTNPFADARDPNKRYVFTYGHRNIQGLAQRADGSVWSVEHGTTVDDEVNLLRAGGNYGWAPGPGYDQNVPMTDQSLPGPQIEAQWSSGDPTLATSGAGWVSGAQWGSLDGTLAVAALKASEVVFMRFGRAGALQWTVTPPELTTYGRLRSVTALPDGDLLITTTARPETEGGDVVLRVSPRP